MENPSPKNKLDHQVISELNSGHEKVILKALRRLRNLGNSHYIPELFKVLSNCDNENVKKEIVRFLADIKKSAVLPYILKGLRDSELKGVHGDIVSACWQSGLDYSSEAELFIKLFIEGDYRTALESFTVIEESVVNMKEEDIGNIRNLLIKKLELVRDEKKPLALELLKLFQA